MLTSPKDSNFGKKGTNIVLPILAEMSIVEIGVVVASIITAVGTSILLLKEKSRKQDVQNSEDLLAFEKKKEEEREEIWKKREKTLMEHYEAVLADERKRAEDRKKIHERDMAKVERELASQEAKIHELSEENIQCRVLAARQDERLTLMESKMKNNEKRIEDQQKEIDSLKSALISKGINPPI